MSAKSPARTLPGASGAAVPVRSLAALADLGSAAILEAVAKSAKELVRSSDLDQSLPKVIEHIGLASDVNRAHIFTIDSTTQDGCILSHHLWVLPGTPASPAFDHPADSMAAAGLGPWAAKLAKGDIIVGHVRDFDAPARALFESGQVKSALAVPVFAENEWWGFVGLDDCRNERDWTSAELDALRTLAELIGAAVARVRRLKELADAEHIIENSPTVLFRVAAIEPFPLLFLSRNSRRYGFDPDAVKALPGGWQRLIDATDLPAVMTNTRAIAAGDIEHAVSEFRVNTRAGGCVWFESRSGAIRDEHGRITAIEGILTDITERKQAAEQIAALARTDSLTGLANRAAFLDRLQTEFARARRDGNPFAILYLDLDHFKDINDTLGHTVGDALLVAVAERLKNCLRATDLIGRIGGDEFAVLQVDASDSRRIEALAAKIGETLAAPFSINGNQVHTAASIGIVPWHIETETPITMMVSADLALYRAKDCGRNQFQLYASDLDRQARDRGVIGEDLHLAVQRGEFELYYQPQWELATGSVVGLEALIRWNHPSRGLVLPDDFIPVAEVNGTILPIGRWTIVEACRQIRAWQDAGLTPPVVSVNISAAQLKLAPDFDQIVTGSLADCGLAAHQLELELTESVLMETTRRNKDLFDRLERIGVRLAIDDFGTGYSSLDYLATFHVNRLKIDRRFIKGVTISPEDDTIVRATVSLAHELDIEVVAEGVENARQQAFLLSAGCNAAQGNYMFEPMPVARISALLRH